MNESARTRAFWSRESVADITAFMVIGALVAISISQLLSYPELARVFPLAVAAICATLVTLATIMLLVTRRPMGKSADDLDNIATLGSTAWYLLWIGLFCGLLFILGFVLGGCLFIAAFLSYEARMAWLRVAVSCAGWTAFIYLVNWVFPIRWPESALGLLP